MIRTISIAAVLSLVLSSHLAAEPPRGSDAVRQQVRAKAISYLRQKGQSPDGSFTSAAGPGVTALITAGLLRNGLSPKDPMVQKSLAYLEKHIRDDGGIHQKGTLYRNYETCLAVVCFKEANQDGKYDAVLKRADRFIKGLQWDESEGKDPSDTSYGGAGYGKHKRPDLSNTNFFIEALKATGNDADSEAIKRALIFISRCQNLESEKNTTPFAAKIEDGGFYYTPAAGGTSQAGTTDNGGLRSYGSMTYAGLKSMIYAGVGPDDKRVQAAFKWAQKNYDLKSNPGLGDAGLFYYYHTFAKALDAMGKDVIVDAQNQSHHWRDELVMELRRRQRPDGSFVNGNARWLEGDSNLVTGYALLTLSYCEPAKSKPQR